MSDYKFSECFRVRYSEVDGQKAVFNSHYLTYIDTALFSYFRNLHPGQEKLLVDKDYFEFVLLHLELDFLAPGFLEDVLEVFCKITRLGNSSFDGSFLIRRKGENKDLARATINYAFVDVDKRKSKPMPEQIRRLVSEFENLV